MLGVEGGRGYMVVVFELERGIYVYVDMNSLGKRKGAKKIWNDGVSFFSFFSESLIINISI
jgi:hypothetical protein